MLRRSPATLAVLVLVLVLVLGLLGCKTVEEIESDEVPSESIGGDFTAPGINEGQRELDSNLCWESIRPTSASDEAMQQAYDECMAQKGYTRGP